MAPPQPPLRVSSLRPSPLTPFLPQPERLDWVSAETHREARRHITAGGGAATCDLCGWTNNRKRVLVYAKQHHHRYYCACNFESASDDSVGRHSNACKYPECGRGCFAVEEALYQEFTSYMGWENTAPYGVLTPTYIGLMQRKNHNPRPRGSTAPPLGPALGKKEHPRKRRRDPSPLEAKMATPSPPLLISNPRSVVSARPGSGPRRGVTGLASAAREGIYRRCKDEAARLSAAAQRMQSDLFKGQL